MSPIDQLRAVLCDPSGKCCIDGSDEDRAIIDRALQALAQPEQEPVAYADALDLAKDCNWDTFICKHSSENHEGTRFKIPLYTAPPKLAQPERGCDLRECRRKVREADDDIKRKFRGEE